MQGVYVLQNVRLLVGNEHHVQLVERLVDEANVVLLDCRVLRPRVRRLGERCQQRLDARPLDVVESPCKDGLAATGADGRSEHNLISSSYVSSARLFCFRPAATEPPGKGRETGEEHYHLDCCRRGKKNYFIWAGQGLQSRKLRSQLLSQCCKEVV